MDSGHSLYRFPFYNSFKNFQSQQTGRFRTKNNLIYLSNVLSCLENAIPCVCVCSDFKTKIALEYLYECACVIVNHLVWLTDFRIVTLGDTLSPTRHTHTPICQFEHISHIAAALLTHHIHTMLLHTFGFVGTTHTRFTLRHSFHSNCTNCGKSGLMSG